MTGNDRYDKARALFLALVMVVSVFGVAIRSARERVAFTGTLPAPSFGAGYRTIESGRGKFPEAGTLFPQEETT